MGFGHEKLDVYEYRAEENDTDTDSDPANKKPD